MTRAFLFAVPSHFINSVEVCPESFQLCGVALCIPNFGKLLVDLVLLCVHKLFVVCYPTKRQISICCQSVKAFANTVFTFWLQRGFLALPVPE